MRIHHTQNSPAFFAPKLHAKSIIGWASLGLFVLYTGMLLYKHLTTPPSVNLTNLLDEVLLDEVLPKLNIQEAGAMRLTCSRMKTLIEQYFLIKIRSSLPNNKPQLAPNITKLKPIFCMLTNKDSDNMSDWEMVGAILSLGQFKTNLTELNLRTAREYLLNIENNHSNWVSVNLPAICKKMKIVQDPNESLGTFLERALGEILKRFPEVGIESKKITHLNIGPFCTGSNDLSAFLESPFFEKLGKVTHLDLSECEDLTELPESIRNLTALTHLDLGWCEHLNMLNESIGDLAALTHLDLRGCSRLEKLPDSIGGLAALTHLDLGWCVSLEMLPESIGGLAALTHLDLGWCERLEMLPTSISTLIALTHLYLEGCSRLKKLPDSIGDLTALTYLDLGGCINLTKLPDSFGGLIALSHLYLEGCINLTELPDSFGNLTALSHLYLEGCINLTELPDSIKSLLKN